MFHPSHQLFSRLINHSTDSLTIPLGDNILCMCAIETIYHFARCKQKQASVWDGPVMMKNINEHTSTSKNTCMITTPLAFGRHIAFGSPTCIDLCGLWSSSNSYASRHEFFTVWPSNASRHKLIASQLYLRETEDFLRLAWTCESVGHPSQSPYASSGFANLRRLASPFGQD